MHGRHDLPWQHPATPYRVWVSEVMLQQTQVSTVIPYFERFMQHFPNVESLAAASVDDVLSLWSGLGYYARGRNLHKAAQQIVTMFHGKHPQTVAELISLSGIGQSTAHAILSLAYQQPYAICDGNVKRVLSRWLALNEEIESKSAQDKLWQTAQLLQSQSRAGDYTQAIMDLGATLCTRSKPNCQQCPIAQDCQAKLSGDLVTDWPKRRAKKAKPELQVDMYLYINTENELWLQKSTAQQGIWAGLNQLPNEALLKDVQVFTSLPIMKHVFTHQVWHIHSHVVFAEKSHAYFVANADNGLWYNLQKETAKSIARPVVVDKLWQLWLCYQKEYCK